MCYNLNLGPARAELLAYVGGKQRWQTQGQPGEEPCDRAPPPSSARQDQDVAPTPGLRAIGPRPAAFGARERAWQKAEALFAKTCQLVPDLCYALSTNFVGHLLWTCSSTQIDGNRWQSMAINGNRWQSMAIDLQSMAIDGRLVNARTATNILLFGIFTESQNNLLLFFVLDNNITRNRRHRQVCVLRYFFFQQENTISAFLCITMERGRRRAE